MINKYRDNCRRWVVEHPSVTQYGNHLIGIACAIGVFNTGFMNLFTMSYTHFIVAVYLLLIGTLLLFKEVVDQCKTNRSLQSVIPFYNTLTVLHSENSYAVLCLIGGSLCLEFGWFGATVSVMTILRGVLSLRIPYLEHHLNQWSTRDNYPPLPKTLNDDYPESSRLMGSTGDD